MKTTNSKNNLTPKNGATPGDFWNLPAVKELSEIQKRNPWGSEPHKAAFEKKKEILTLLTSKDFADKIFTEY